MKLIDIAVNLASSQLEGHTDALISQAKLAGVTGLLAVGTSEAASRRVMKLAVEHRDSVNATAGVHPHYADTWSVDTRSCVLEMAKAPEVVAVGECGLDFNRMRSPRVAQLRAFEDQLAIAEALGKPVYLHCRDAFDEFSAILKEHPALHGAVHCFTGTPTQAQTLLELGLDLGVTGWVCDMRRGAALRESVAVVPLGRMHLETDAPYLYPPAPGERPGRRTLNKPEYLPRVLAAVAELKQQPASTVAAAAFENSKQLFAF